MYISTILIFLISFAAYINAARLNQPVYKNHFLNWNCTGPDSNNIPDVCNNMRYGVYCRKMKELEYESIEKGGKNRRAKNAGCGTSHKCGSSEECDEYPFGSTKQAKPPADSVSRCVPKGQNHGEYRECV